tara:strand:+ start:9424 stop:11301 length:1878 start_codon:yes stop_codon:yes gene_type:complete
MHKNVVSQKSICIWDDNKEPELLKGFKLYRWNGYNNTDKTYSLFRYIEDNCNRLRSEYLKFIHDLGEREIAEKSLINHLELNNNLSYWWFTLFVEKSLYKSPISDSIRLFALEEIISKNNPEKILLVSSNKILKKILKDYCKKNNIKFLFKKVLDDRFKFLSVRSLVSYLPEWTKGILFLVKYFHRNWSIFAAKKNDWRISKNNLFVSSYFFGVSLEKANDGEFYSHYWNEFHYLVKDLKINTNWLQNFEVSPSINNSKYALEILNKINSNQEDSSHAFIESYMSLKIFLKVFKNWFKLIIKSYALDVRNLFQIGDSKMSIWPLLKNNWFTSMQGYIAVSNLIYIELFDEVLGSMPRQNKGLYICENQSWERALIHAWNENNHGKLIAVAHSTVRFWDLRYFCDERSYSLKTKNSMPQPNFVALNGEPAVNMYLSAGFRPESILKCEALRYGFLDDYKNYNKNKLDNVINNKILILGDYIHSETDKMLQLLIEANQLIDMDISYFFKPHPACVIDAKKYPSLNLKIVLDPLSKILSEYDVVYTSNMTSASVDSYYAGLPVIVMLNNHSLNYSPLRDQTNVKFVANKEHLSESLIFCLTNELINENKQDFFYLDPQLNKWRDILKS